MESIRKEVNKFIVRATLTTDGKSRVDVIKTALFLSRREGAPRTTTRELLRKLELEIKVSNLKTNKERDATVDCPYCGNKVTVKDIQTINYGTDSVNRATCQVCLMSFTHSAQVEVVYKSKKADCLNGDSHEWEQKEKYPQRVTEMVCLSCGTTRKATKQEASMNNHY